MKRIVWLALALFGAMWTCEGQEKTLYNEIYYVLDPIEGTAQVTETPKLYGDVVIPSEIKVGNRTYRVNEIGEKAFKGNKNIDAIVIPSSIEHIYRSAFDGTGLMKNKAFWENGVLIIDSCLIATAKDISPKYEVPEGVRLIAAGAFENNKTVTRVILPEGLREIDHDTFKGCKNIIRRAGIRIICRAGNHASDFVFRINFMCHQYCFCTCDKLIVQTG